MVPSTRSVLNVLTKEEGTLPKSVSLLEPSIEGDQALGKSECLVLKRSCIRAGANLAHDLHGDLLLRHEVSCHVISVLSLRRSLKSGFFGNIQDIHPLHIIRIDPEEKRRMLREAGVR